MSARATYAVQAAFGIAALTDPTAGQWVDVTAYVRGGSFARGRQHELQRTNAGTLALTLDNADRRFEPENEASPYHPNLRPMTHVRVRATFSAVTYDLFRGYVENWGQGWRGRPLRLGGPTEVTVEAVDAFKVFAQDLAAYSTVVLAEGPLGYWRLDDPGGTPKAANLGSIGEAIDLPYIGGQPGGIAPGPLQGTGAHFDSATGFLTSARNAGLNLAQALTATMLVKLDSLASIENLIELADTSAVYWLRMRTTTGGDLEVTRYVDSVSQTITLQTNLVAGTWYHLALAITAAGVATAFVDGVSVGSASLGSAQRTVFNSNADLIVGLTTVEAHIAHVALWNRALSAERIAEQERAAVFDTFEQQSATSYVGELLDVLGWPAGLRSLDSGTVMVARHVPDGSALDLMLAAAEDTEGGLLHVRGDGVVRLVSHQALLQKITADATFGDGYAHPPDLGSLEAWFDAGQIPFVTDGSTIQTWPDVGGKARDATQATAGNRPSYQTAELNAHPIVRFDGTTDFMETAAFSAALAQPFTIVAVVRRNTEGTLDTFAAGRANRVRLQATATDDWQIDAGSAAAGGDPDTAWHVLVATYTDTDLLHVDGVQVISAAVGANTLDGLTLGADEAAANFLDGDLAEVIVYSKALTTDERQRLEDYLGRKYALASVPLYTGATVGEEPYADAQVRYDDDDLYNRAEIMPASGEPATASDSAAALTYGTRSLERSTRHSDPNDAVGLAEAIVRAYKDPHLRPVLLTLEPGSDSLLTQMLDRDIGDRIALRRRPPGAGATMALEALVEGVRHGWHGADPHDVDLSLVPTFETFWILGDATYGVLGTTTKLGG